MSMLQGITWLLLCQTAGELLVRAMGLPLPGPVLGMLLLMVLLAWPGARGPVGQASEGLLQHLSLLFVPVGVGVMVHLALIARHGLGMLLALVLSTWIGLAVTALVLQAMLRRSGPGSGADGDAAADASTEGRHA